MRQISEEFKNHLASGATTICQCWLIERADNIRQGFTDHDEPIQFEGVQFQPQSGFTASEAVSNLGLGVDSGEVEGALNSERISAAALHAGDYDNAKVTVFVVNWRQPDQRVILRQADIGEVTCEDGIFRAELRGILHQLNQVQGRLFENTCNADLGDSRCRVNLDNASFNGQGSISQILDVQTYVVSGLSGFPDAWFDRGLLTWTTGENQGRTVEIEAQYAALGSEQLRIWLPMPNGVEVGDEFHAVTGCDKLFPTCQAKFTNVENFRGFPHIPGNDFAYSFARATANNNGQPLVR